MTEYTAKKVIFKNRDNEYLIPYIDNVYTKEEIDELLKDVPSGGGETSGGGDTIPLYTGMYFDFTPNNLSWLGAGVQKSGEMYETAYNGLVKALNASMGVSTLASATITENITPTKVGTVNDDPIETQAYYFSENDYLTTTLEVGSEPFELQFKFTTGTDVTSGQALVFTDNIVFSVSICNGKFYIYSYGEDSAGQCLPSTTYTCAVGRQNGMTYYKFSTDGGNNWQIHDYKYPAPDTSYTFNFGKPNYNSEYGVTPLTGGVIDLTSFILTSTKSEETSNDIIFDGKVVDVEAMIDGVDYSEYWKVDINAMTFTTPTAISNKALSGAIVGNGYSLGLTDGTNVGGLTLVPYDGGHPLMARKGNENLLLPNTSTSGNGNLANGVIGVSTDPATSGLVAEQSTAQLYFKVANKVQDIELINAGYILENMVDKQNMSAVSVCIEEYVNGDSGYRIYSDVGNGRYCEQWGLATQSGDNYIAFLKQYKDKNFIVNFQRRYVGETSLKSDTGTANRNTVAHSSQYGVINGEGMYIYVTTENGCTGVGWHTKGYLA